MQIRSEQHRHAARATEDREVNTTRSKKRKAAVTETGKLFTPGGNQCKMHSLVLEVHCLCGPSLPAVVGVMEKTERPMMDRSSKNQPAGIGSLTPPKTQKEKQLRSLQLYILVAGLCYSGLLSATVLLLLLVVCWISCLLPLFGLC
ncbi:hypothetical protein SRHO_G00081350 [Serrasalmus rhombeus]